MKIIKKIVKFGTSSENKDLLHQEIYIYLMRTLSNVKSLDIRAVYQVPYPPKVNPCLDSLCELTCDVSVDPSYYFGLTVVCKDIERLVVINTDVFDNDGLIRLIEVQRILKYFEWRNELRGFDPYYEN